LPSWYFAQRGRDLEMTSGEPLGAADVIDREVLARFLSEHVAPYDHLEIRLLAGGASNLTFLLLLDDRRLVLRRRPLGNVAPRAHDMAREFTVLKALSGTNVPVPSVIAFHGDDDLVGAPCYLMGYTAGVVLHAPADADKVDEGQAAEISVELIRRLGDLHAVDVESVGLSEFGKPAGFVERRIHGWLRQWDGVAHRDMPAVAALGAELLSRVPPQIDSTLIHGDYRLGNVIIELGPVPRVRAIVDWELSTLGDPLTDLAHLIIYWESHTGEVSHPAQLIARRPGFLSGAELGADYARRTGRDVSQLAFYLAFEHWRGAIIKEGIYQRGMARPEGPDDGTAAMGAAVSSHLRETEALLAGPGLVSSDTNGSQQ
jgi:aminoglycoside phosphotransferase (APT) family kinase protein